MLGRDDPERVTQHSDRAAPLHRGEPTGVGERHLQLHPAVRRVDPLPARPGRPRESLDQKIIRHDEAVRQPRAGRDDEIHTVSVPCAPPRRGHLPAVAAYAFGMPIYIAFLRAINLGSRRTFAQSDIVRATEAASGTAVATHGNTGNVRLSSPLRSLARVQSTLEQAYAADRGFAVPTVVFTPDELRTLTERGLQLRAVNEPGARHYVTLYSSPPSAERASAVRGLDYPGERCLVEGRAAYVLVDGDVHTSRLLATPAFAALGEGTARTITVLRTLVDTWC